MKKKHFISRIILLFSFFCAQITFGKMEYQEIQKAYKQSYQYEKTQNYNDAIKAIQIVSLNYPNTYTVNLRLGHLFLLNGKYANARKHYSLAQKALPNAISPMLGEMSLDITAKKYSDVETLGFRILKIDLYNYYGNLKLAFALTMQNKLDSALKITSKMLIKYPEDTFFLVQQARIYSLKKLSKIAIQIYQNILTLDPENVEAKYYLSKVYQNKKSK